MRIATRVAGVAGATALGIVSMGATAFADSAENDGINLLNDNNISAVPVQLCGNDIAAVLGFIEPTDSSQTTNCVNAPIVDHPNIQN